MLRILKVSIVVFIISLTNYAFAKQNFIQRENIVLDNTLNLMWQDDKKGANNKLFLKNAIDYCKKLDLISFSNWRLPSYEELLSIGDYEVYKPTINQKFKNTASGHYWSIVYKRVAYGDEWKAINDYYVKRIYFSDGFSYDNDRTGKAYVRCVRSF